jgi:hypothetical protein
VNTGFSNGILVVEVTATDFTLTTSDVSAKFSTNYICGGTRGWTDMLLSSPNATNVILFRSPGGAYAFQCTSGESGSIYIKINFKTPNPTPDGKYLVRIWMET